MVLSWIILAMIPVNLFFAVINRSKVNFVCFLLCLSWSLAEVFKCIMEVIK